MKTIMLLVACIAVAVAAGCMVRTIDPSPAVAANGEQSFGEVPIIRPGMAKDEVEVLLGEQGAGTYIDASSYTPAVFSYADSGLKVVYLEDRVESSRSITTVVSGPFQQNSISESALNKLLRPGMTPKEVAAKLGQPKCGYENVAGRVSLIYGKGVEASYVDFALNQWRRTTYSAEATK